MFRRVRKNYLRVVMPLIILSVLLSCLMLILSDFGFIYMFREPVDIKNVPVNQLEGAYVKININDIEGTYARYGAEAEDESGAPDIVERYCVFVVDEDKYIGVRITGDHLDEIQAMYNAFEAFGEEKGREMDFGTLVGTISHYESVDKNLYSFLCDWVKDAVLAKPTAIANPFVTEEEQATLEEIQYCAEHVLPYILEVDHMGGKTNTTVYVLFIFAVVFIVFAVVIALTIPFGVWTKSVRTLVSTDGLEAVNNDFDNGKSFGNALHVGKQYIWWFKRIGTEVFKTEDVIWAYPRSKRLEGGKLRWSVVLKTGDKREYGIVLGEADEVQKAISDIEAQGYLISIGFDKQKQQLFEKDINQFKGYIKKEKKAKEEAEKNKTEFEN